MDLNEVSVFIKVVQTGSFSAAAKDLKMPNSTVSSKVSGLERRLGTTLIQRTTRKLNVTPAGHAFFQRALAGLELIQSAQAELQAHQVEPQGTLRMTAPVEFGATILAPIISAFAVKYPLVTTELILTDRRVDLLAESVDLAIRAGPLKDSSLIAKGLGSISFAPFASPKYLKTAGTPESPKDLKQHHFVRFTPLLEHEWRLRKEGDGRASTTIAPDGPIIVNDLNTMKTLAASGNGIAMLPGFFCYPEIKSGKLVRLLPGWHAEQNPVHFVYPGQKHVSSKLSAFIAFATEPIRRSLGGN